jgi:hypothetical protein
MTKSLTIIDAYAPTTDKQKLLIECIESCKGFATDIMLVSHNVLPEHIVNRVDYYIFDKDNRFNTTQAWAWKTVGDVTVTLNIHHSHEFPIIKSMRNAFSLADALGYEFFYFTEFDHEFSNTDIQKLELLKNELCTTNKNFLFMKPVTASWNMNGVDLYGIYYETSFFAGKVRPFVQRFTEYFPILLEEFEAAQNKNDNPHCLEHLFYDAFKDKAEETIIIEQYVKEYLMDSKINRSSYKSTTSVILPSNVNKNYLYISNDNMEPLIFKIYMNDQKVQEYSLTNTTVAQGFQLLELSHDAEIRVDVYEEETLIQTHMLTYREANTDAFRATGMVNITTACPDDEIIIVNSYIDSSEKESILRDSLIQLKKLGRKIVLMSNSMILSETVLALCDFHIYSSENLLLPPEQSPFFWHADNLEIVYLYCRGINLTVTRGINIGLHFAKNFGYKKFIYLEYDTIIHDADFPLLNTMFKAIDQKKAFFCKFGKEPQIGYETRIFSGDVDFFISNIPLPKTYKEWNTTHPYSTNTYTLEFIFPTIFEKYIDEIELYDGWNAKFLENSRVDIFTARQDANIVYNVNNPSNPLLFIVGMGAEYLIEINGVEIDKVWLNKHQLKKYYFTISDETTVVTVTRNQHTSTFEVGHYNIDTFKPYAVRRNI